MQSRPVRAAQEWHSTEVCQNRVEDRDVAAVGCLSSSARRSGRRESIGVTAATLKNLSGRRQRKPQSIIGPLPKPCCNGRRPFLNHYGLRLLKTQCANVLFPVVGRHSGNGGMIAASEWPRVALASLLVCPLIPSFWRSTSELKDVAGTWSSHPQ